MRLEVACAARGDLQRVDAGLADPLAAGLDIGGVESDQVGAEQFAEAVGAESIRFAVIVGNNLGRNPDRRLRERSRTDQQKEGGLI